MKKYQLWLERKTYSQHLNNLIRIKLDTSLRKVSPKLNLPMRDTPDRANESLHKGSSVCMSVRDKSYLITAQQLKMHKMRLVRSNEIVRENKELVKRLNTTKPFVSNNRPIDYTNYKLKRMMKRTNEWQNEELKDKNYKLFLKNHNQKVKNCHKYQLSLAIEDLERKVSSHPHTEISIEILDQHPIAKSENVNPNQIKDHVFQFALPNALPETFTILIHQFKNLEHCVIGEYLAKRPQEGASTKGEWKSKRTVGSITTRMTYSRILPKFYSIKLFKV